MTRLLRLATGGLALAAALPAAADGIYKCRQANGQLAYQDHPCGAGAQEAGTLAGGFAASVTEGDPAAAHYRSYIDMVERNEARLQAERSRAGAAESIPP